MHDYPLHRPIDVECSCCQLVQQLTFTSNHDQVVCKACARHAGTSHAKLKQRNAEHLGLWTSEVAILCEELQGLRETAAKAQQEAGETIKGLTSEVARLKEEIVQGFSDASPADVREIMTQQVVLEAESARDGAYRARDRLYQLLWRLNEKHRPQEDSGTCVCAQKHCPVAEAVSDDDRADLYQWEDRNRKRSLSGKPHGLPRDHPDYHDWRRAY